jgi:hypothetical protein
VPLLNINCTDDCGIDALELFRAYDRDGNNRIDFNEFVSLSTKYEKGKAFDGSWLKDVWEHGEEKEKAYRSLLISQIIPVLRESIIFYVSFSLLKHALQWH